MTTYTKTFAICPHCGAKTDSALDHLPKGQSFGPWYCDDCGCGYKGIANGSETDFVKVESRFIKTLDLLMLEPQKKPVYFVLAGKHFADGDSDHTYFYEEHSCPTNWIHRTEMIATGGDTDPHGVLKFLRSEPYPDFSNEPNEQDTVIVELFPEVSEP